MGTVGHPRIYPNHAAKIRAYRQRKRQAPHLKRQVYHRAVSAEWETPQDFFAALHAEFGFTLDVAAQPNNAKCARYFTREDDGLTQSWTGICWCNPPYGKTMAQWMRKAYESAQQGATVVCLVPARTEMEWWHTYAMRGEIRYVKGRLKFGGSPYNAPFPSAVVIFRPSPLEIV